jgi:hypothetical protein
MMGFISDANKRLKERAAIITNTISKIIYFILFYKDYICGVPFIIDENDNIIIKTVFPGRNFHKIYKEKLK